MGEPSAHGSDAVTRSRREIRSGRRPWNPTFKEPRVSHPRIGRVLTRASLLRLLVEADYVSCRIAEPRSDLGRVGTDRLHDLASVSDDHVQGRGHTVNHDVKQKAGLGGGRAPDYPCPAHFAGGIVKGGAAITAFPDVPAEDALVEVSRARNVGGGHLDVADLAVRKRRGHQSSWRAFSLTRNSSSLLKNSS